MCLFFVVGVDVDVDIEEETGFISWSVDSSRLITELRDVDAAARTGVGNSGSEPEVYSLTASITSESWAGLGFLFTYMRMW